MRTAFFRLPPLVASTLFVLGLLVISYAVGFLMGDPAIDAITLTMSLALGIDFFVLMRSRTGAPRFGTPITRSLVLVLPLVLLSAIVSLFYFDHRPFWMILLAAFGASVPAFLAIARKQAYPVR